MLYLWEDLLPILELSRLEHRFSTRLTEKSTKG